MEQAILITQCLQNDFVKLIDKFDPLPNQLHVGYSEARRLLGECIEDGPVNTVMDWAYGTADDQLKIIHIRDWHDSTDPAQQAHLKQFGDHCLMDSNGAAFVFEQYIKPERSHTIINATGLNDFIGTGLDTILDVYRGQKIKVGITGVWTEAKILFLCYDLGTRYPEFEIGICSALTAGSSREMHFISLDQIKNILNVTVFSSVGSFTQFLTGEMPEIKKKLHSRLDGSMLTFDQPFDISDSDKKLILYLFRNSKQVDIKCLDGGYSGNLVLKAKSINIFEHQEVPTVIKVGPRDLIAKERIAFEKIQEVLGNSAPNIVDFAEIEERGAIKYRYAAMLEGEVRTFQDIFKTTDDEAMLMKILDTVYKEQLGRLYKAGRLEKVDLLDYYDFKGKYAPHVRKNVAAIIGSDPTGDTFEIVDGYPVYNLCHFYEKELPAIQGKYTANHYMAYIHGDLNGRNIIIDSQENVWIIDFFHTHLGHIIRDLVKMESDMLYIYTEVNSPEELREAFKLTDILLDIDELGAPIDADADFSYPQFNKTLRMIKHLRSYYRSLIKTDKNPFQLFIALLRYSAHNLSFDESNEYQKKWALYCSAQLAEKIHTYIAQTTKLRIDYLTYPLTNNGKIGLTILPGRKDRDRILSDDIQTMKDSGITAVVCLLTDDEFTGYGVKDLKKKYKKAGFKVDYFPIKDQGIPTLKDIQKAADWIDSQLAAGGNVLIHCVGGLGRSGVMAAAYLVLKHDMSPVKALSIVRDSRSPRAIENKVQEDFIMGLR